MKWLLSLLMALGILVSGCTNTGGLTVQNAGGIIKDISFDFGSVFDDETSVLSVEIQNVGGKMIDSTNLYIYGQSTGDNDDVWKVVSSMPGVTQSTPYISDTISGADFAPPDSEQGIPGEGRLYSFILDPPNMLDGIPPVKQDFYARLCFPYSTSTLSQVELTSKNEMRANKITNTKADTINAAGPVQLELKTLKNLRSVSNGKELPLVFSIKDVGGGFATLPSVPCTVDTNTADRGWVTVTVTVDGQAADCGEGKVLIRNGEGTIYCKKSFGTAETPRTSYRIVATAEYNYYVEKSASILVTDSSLD